MDEWTDGFLLELLLGWEQGGRRVNLDVWDGWDWIGMDFYSELPSCGDKCEIFHHFVDYTFLYSSLCGEDFSFSTLPGA